MTEEFAIGYQAALEAAAKWLRQEGKKRRNDAKGLAGEERAYAVASGLALEAVAFDVENLPVPSLRETLAAMVKPLEWIYDERRGVWDAQDGLGGHYTVSDSQWFHRSLSEFIWVDGGDEAAMAAAQADYTRRILSALGVTE